MHNSGSFLTLPDAPSISGLTFRLFQGEADIPALQEVRQAVQSVDGNVNIPAPDKNSTSICNPLQDCLIAEIEGRMICFTWFDRWVGTDNAQVYLHLGSLVPQWRRKGIGRAILHWQQQRLRQIASSHPSAGPLFFGDHAIETQLGTHALLLSEGYHVAFTRVGMAYRLPTTPIQRLPLPDNLDLRPFERKLLPALYAANDEAFQDYRLDYNRETYEDFLNDIHWPHVNTDLWFIAWDRDQIAGLVINEINGNRGETLWTAVRRPWRKRGLARVLMLHTLKCFQEHAVTHAEVATVIENPGNSFQLYKSIGYSVTRRLLRYRKAMRLTNS